MFIAAELNQLRCSLNSTSLHFKLETECFTLYYSVFVNPLSRLDSSENVFFNNDLPTDNAFKACWFILFFQTDLRIFFFVFDVRFFGTAIMSSNSYIKNSFLS